MCVEVTAASKLLVTTRFFALERPVAGMCPSMSRETARVGEEFAAMWILAGMRLLASMNPSMYAESRALRSQSVSRSRREHHGTHLNKGLATSRMRADVWSFSGVDAHMS